MSALNVQLSTLNFRTIPPARPIDGLSLPVTYPSRIAQRPSPALVQAVQEPPPAGQVMAVRIK